MKNEKAQEKIADLARRLHNVINSNPDDFLSFAEISGSFAAFRARNPQFPLGQENKDMAAVALKHLNSSLEKNAENSVVISFVCAKKSFLRLSKISQPFPPDAQKIYAALGYKALRYVQKIMADPACDKQHFKPIEMALFRRLYFRGIKTAL